MGNKHPINISSHPYLTAHKTVNQYLLYSAHLSNMCYAHIHVEENIMIICKLLVILISLLVVGIAMIIIDKYLNKILFKRLSKAQKLSYEIEQRLIQCERDFDNFVKNQIRKTYERGEK